MGSRLLPPTVWWEEGRGGARASVSAGAGDSAASSLMGVGVAGSSHSQESPVLADPCPVASSVSAGRDRWSRSREIGEFTGGRSRSRSSRSSPSRARDSCEEHHCARSRSRESRSRSTDRLRSRGRERSRRDSSRSPSARVQSRQSRLRSSDRYRDRRMHSRSRSDHSRSRRLRLRSSGCREARRDRLRSHGSHYRSRDRSPLSSDRSQSRKRSWRPGWSRHNSVEAVVASQDRGNSGSTVEPAPVVEGGSIPLPTSSLLDLVRMFLSLSGSVAQQDAAVVCLLTAAGVTGAGVLPGPATPVTSAAPVACPSASVPTPGVVTPAGAASATTSPGRCECARESSRPERCRKRSFGRERSRSDGKRGRDWSHFPARSARSVSASASSSSESSDTEERVSAMPPPPAGLPGVGGSRSKGDRSVSGRDHSPQPGPSGLGSDEWSAPSTDRSHLGYSGCSSPAPSGVAEDDHDSSSNSVDLDRDDSFGAVLCLIREFHNMEKPASVAPNWCKTSLALINGLQSETSPALHLPLSPLLRSLLEDTNLALSKFVEDQTIHKFLPFPGRCHRRYYKTSSSSFPGLYTVPPRLASITLDKVSEPWKRSVSLSHSQVSSLETMLSSVCEVTSWLDWWLSACGGFQEQLTTKLVATSSG